MAKHRVGLVRVLVIALVMTSIATVGRTPVVALGADYGGSFPWAFGAQTYGAYVAGVNVGTRSLTYSVEDFSFPGKLPMRFVRWYNSAYTADVDPLLQWTAMHPFGIGWTHSFNWFITATLNNKAPAVVHRGDGGLDTYYWAGWPWTAKATDSDAVLSYTGELFCDPESPSDCDINQFRYDLRMPDGVTYHFAKQYGCPFDGGGTGACLTRIDDPAGDHIDLSYTSPYGLTSISSQGRTISLGLRFTSSDVVYEENHRVVLSAVTLARQGHRRSQLRGREIS